MTSGAGFIGSVVVRYLIGQSKASVLDVDKLTYAGNLDSLASITDSPDYQFAHSDICDRDEMQRSFDHYQPTHVMHLAAESHVDRSIDGPFAFIKTNIMGTYTLLEVAWHYVAQLPGYSRDVFRFLHISNDEVYGDLVGVDALFTEDTLCQPSSPYSASKASNDHLVRSWHR